MRWTIFLLLVVVALPSHTASIREFRGEIADSSCAMNVHSLTRSHREMLRAKYLGSDAGACARYCVRNLGSVFVLVSGKDVYHLDRQQDAEKFAGSRVVLRGTLEEKTDTIQVTSIEAAQGSHH